MSKITIPECIANKIDFDKVKTQDDLDTAIRQAYDACRRELPCDCSKGRSKREPSVYNQFISDCFAERKSAGQDVSKASVVLSECAGEYRKAHPKK